MQHWALLDHAATFHPRREVVSRMVEGEIGEIFDAAGYCDTGDIATIDTYGFMQITARAKDLIKSGGEWISSIELENAAVGHPAISEPAAIAIPHPKWGERPLLLAVGRTGAQLEGAPRRDPNPTRARGGPGSRRHGSRCEIDSELE
jgi:acyl-CoA synthetase (AMP-forming)/AMP-acid ligase II